MKPYPVLTRLLIFSSLLLTVFCSFQTLIFLPAIAASTTNTTVDAESIVGNLQASDLPPRFEPAPPFLRHFIYKGIAAVQPNLEAEGISQGNVSSFVDFEQAELVLGMTAVLASEEAAAKFDASLSRADAKDIFIKGVEETLKGVGSLKLTQIQELNSLKAVGNRARGFSFQADFQGLPLQLFGEAVAFRRNRIVALVVIGAINHPPAEIHVQDLAMQLDRRFFSYLKKE
jgi:hypothetical protein